MPERICSAPRCNRPVGRHGAYGLCPRCYKRVQTFGSTELPTAAERFWKKVNKNGPTSEQRPELGPCWLWRGRPNRHGYGRFGHDGRVDLAHRVAYELLVGPIPAGFEPDHLCRVPSCVKAVADEHGPAHLEAVTHAENMQRGAYGAAIHCQKGHPFNEANTWMDKRGYRWCRTCQRERQRSYRAAKSG